MVQKTGEPTERTSSFRSSRKIALIVEPEDQAGALFLNRDGRGSSHLIEDLIDGSLEWQRRPYLVDRMDLWAVLPKEDAFFSDLERNRCAGQES